MTMSGQRSPLLERLKSDMCDWIDPRETWASLMIDVFWQGCG
jgi:hypothetical protein